MYENSKVAKQAVIDSREKLQAPPRAAGVWPKLPEIDRLMLCRAAKLPKALAYTDWMVMRDNERGRIVRAAERASQWARNLGILAAAAP